VQDRDFSWARCLDDPWAARLLYPQNSSGAPELGQRAASGRLGMMAQFVAAGQKITRPFLLSER